MRVVFAAVGALTMLGAARPSDAQPAEALARVAVVATNEDARGLDAALAERLLRLGLRVQLLRIGPEVPDAPWSDDAANPRSDHGAERARVWIDMQPASYVTIRLATVHGRTLDLPLERRIPRSDSHAIMVEQVSEIVYDTLESMLANDRARPPVTGASPATSGATDSKSAGAASHSVPSVSAETSSRGAAAAPRVPAAQIPGRALDLTLSVDAFASARGFSDEAGALIGGGAAAELRVGRSQWHSSLWLSAVANSPFDEHVAAFTLETTVSCLRAVPTMEIFDRRGMRLDAGVGGGVDLLRTVPRDMPSSMYPFDVPLTAVDAVATGRVVLRAAVPSGAAIVVAADADYDPAPHAYRAPMSAGSRNAVFEPWSVRPAVMLGLCVPMAGHDACSPVQ